MRQHEFATRPPDSPTRNHLTSLWRVGDGVSYILAFRFRDYARFWRLIVQTQVFVVRFGTVTERKGGRIQSERFFFELADAEAAIEQYLAGRGADGQPCAMISETTLHKKG